MTQQSNAPGSVHNLVSLRRSQLDIAFSKAQAAFAELYDTTLLFDSHFRELVRCEEALVIAAQRGTGHKLDLRWRLAFNGRIMCVYASCSKCRLRHTGTLSKDAARLLTPAEFILYEVTPLLQELADRPCDNAEVRAELAEWITLRLVEAGPEGLLIDELVREAPDGPIVATLERIGYRGGERVWLPVGHPMRTW